MSEEETDFGQYDTGTFCGHWNDPSDCDEICLNCGHRCIDHEMGNDTSCNECDCEEWKEK